ncbi:hypothetical protein QR680_016251 [Steinernema hermaphroditum]|uniref:Serpentine receptor class gamma n=1 Tax=Steinernema hermaphroditum TaxID=289476 RepID=A0AA39LMB2_9BILA|nr:hypothetical protein QR680_016251 [Steinernema hermaphroditum]
MGGFELYLFRHNTWSKLFNCSMKTSSQWYAYGTTNVPFGIYCFLIGSFYMVSTVPCVYVMIRTKSLRIHASYKIMTFLSIMQCTSLLINCFMTGYLFIDGAVFCNYPHQIYIASCMMYGLWEAQLSTCVLLAFNRLMEFWNAKCISRYFDGRRVFFWFIGPIAIGVFYAFHGSASLFNSTYWNWLQDPYIGTDIEHDPESYISNSAIYANMTCEIVIAIMYTVLVGSLIWQSRKANAKVMSKLQRSITIQSALLTSLDFVTGFAYVYMNYGVAGEPLIVFSLITYQASCGIGGVVYIAFNKTIRSQLLPHFPKNTIAVVSITPNRVGNPN